MNVRRRADRPWTISETLRSRRSGSPTPSGRNRFAPVHVHGFWKPSIGPSIDDFGVLTNRAVFVQDNVVGDLERKRGIRVTGTGENGWRHELWRTY